MLTQLNCYQLSINGGRLPGLSFVHDAKASVAAYSRVEEPSHNSDKSLWNIQVLTQSNGYQLFINDSRLSGLSFVHDAKASVAAYSRAEAPSHNSDKSLWNIQVLTQSNCYQLSINGGRLSGLGFA